jgi:hypothetical protein
MYSWNRPTGDTTLKKTHHEHYLKGGVEISSIKFGVLQFMMHFWEV